MNDSFIREKIRFKVSPVIIILAAIQLILLISALISIKRRSSYHIRGRKVWWVLFSFVNYIGPVTYFLFGRIDSKDRKDFL